MLVLSKAALAAHIVNKSTTRLLCLLPWFNYCQQFIFFVEVVLLRVESIKYIRLNKIERDVREQLSERVIEDMVRKELKMKRLEGR